MQNDVARMAHNSDRFLPSSLVLFSCAPEVLSRMVIILFEMPISTIFCTSGYVSTSARTCALRLSSCSCGVETPGIFRFLSVLIPKNLLSLESYTSCILSVKILSAV